jgi:AcrR family transcriptional regulator
MGRPRDADPERTRATILDAAEDEFAEHGFHGTRMVAIA